MASQVLGNMGKLENQRIAKRIAFADTMIERFGQFGGSIPFWPPLPPLHTSYTPLNTAIAGRTLEPAA